MPSAKRIALGLILAGSVPGCVVALLALALPWGTLVTAFGFGAFFGIFYGVVPALVFGLPAIYLLRGVVRPSLASSLIAGMTVATVPVVFFALTAGLGSMALALYSVPLGAIGGATFWLVAFRPLTRIKYGDTPPWGSGA